MTASNVEHICDVPNFDGGDGLVAIIIRNQKIKRGVEFLTPDYLPQQVALMNHPKGYKVVPHYHPKRVRTVQQTQEVLIIASGKVELTLYMTNKVNVKRTLAHGDVAILIQGGHSLIMLEDTEIIEVKQGPYHGKEIDKVELPNP